MAENSSEKKSGCGLLNVMFGRRGLWPKKPADEDGHKSTTSNNNNGNINNNNTTTTNNVNKIQYTKSPGNGADIERGSAGVDERAFADSKNRGSEQPQKAIMPKPSLNPSPNQNNQLAGSGTHQPYNNSNGNIYSSNNNRAVQQQGRKLPKEAIGISGELEMMIADHQKSKAGSTLVRASSSNVMLFGDLGNIRQQGGGEGATGGNYTNSQNVMNSQNNGYQNSTTGYGTRRQTREAKAEPSSAPAAASQEQSGSLCRALSTRMDPETLKIMGNEDYKNGNFAEALALYDAAISIDPDKASYRSNKSAALTALGRILEAVFECREAIRIEPHYHRAHHRLASLYLRLGEVDKAIYHYKHAGPEADREDIAKAKVVQGHINRCTDAKRLRDWNTLIKESGKAISAGADSAPQIYALQAEGLLKTHRHQEADSALSKSPNFGVDSYTRYYGPIGYASILVVRAQVDLAAGRFDEAWETIQRAAKLDSNNREVSMVMRRVKGVTAARSKGNELFKADRFNEASAAYGEGLEHDPRNSVLLCNRAACRSKMGQYGRAVEDCTAALSVRPGYSKARLRRADCNVKLGNWGLAAEDYEILHKETPDDEDVAGSLSEARLQMKKQRGQ